MQCPGWQHLCAGWQQPQPLPQPLPRHRLLRQRRQSLKGRQERQRRQLLLRLLRLLRLLVLLLLLQLLLLELELLVLLLEGLLLLLQLVLLLVRIVRLRRLRLELLWRLRLLVLLRLLLVLLLLQWLLVLLRLEGRLLLRCLRVGRICARSSTRHMSYRAQHLHSVQGMQGLGRTLVLRRAAHALRTTGGLLRHLLLRLVVLPLLLLLIHARPRCSRWAGVANSHIRSVIC